MAGVLGLDIGGSSVKTWIGGYDPQTSHQPITVGLPLNSSPDTGLVEFNPEQWWKIIVDAIYQCIESNGRPIIKAVVISSIRQAFLLTNETSEVGFGIHNADRRGIDGLDIILEQLGHDELYDLTGHWFAPQLTLPKLLAIRKYEPERWARSTRLMFVHDWIGWRLTGVWKNERTLATSSQLCEVRTGSWASELLNSLDFRQDILGEIIDGGEILGYSKEPKLPDLLGVPIVAGAGDAHFLAHGARNSDCSQIVIVAGSTTPIQTVTKLFPADELRRPWISSALVPGHFSVEMNAGYTGVAFDWLCSSLQLTLTELGNRAWAESEIGARGVVALTASPSWDRNTWLGPVPFSFARLNQAHQAADVARAIFEAHAYAIRANVEALDETVKAGNQDLVLTGGWARDSRFSQLLADITGRNIRVVQSISSSITVSMFLASHSIEGVEKQSPESHLYEPRRDSVGYEEYYQNYIELYRHSIVNDPIRTGLEL